MADHRLTVGSSRSLCIRTTQVHDWCYKDSLTTLTLADLALPERMADVAGVECAILDLTCGVLARSKPADGVAVVTLRKQATLDLTFVDGNGLPIPVTVDGERIETQRRTRFWDEFIKIAAPETAAILCELTDAGCRTALTNSGGGTAVTVELFDIQSIAAEETVRMDVDTSSVMRPAKVRAASRPYTAGRNRGA